MASFPPTSSFRTVFAVVLAVVLVALPASAQVSQTEGADSRIAVLEELVASQETLIMGQQALIDEQEDLLNAYRCLFDVDVEVVPGGCPGAAPQALSAEEAADAALLCAGWLAEREATQLQRTAWRGGAIILQSGAVDTSHPALMRLVATVDRDYSRISPILPSLQSEPLAGLMAAMAEAIKAISDNYASSVSDDDMAASIYAALDRLEELDEELARICK